MTTEGKLNTVSETVRDRFWIWGHDAGASNAEWNLPKPSRITPVEAAAYLDVPNLLMVKYGGEPIPPYEQYAVPMRALNRIIWSIIGARGEQSPAEIEYALRLARREQSISGLVMDDFINWDTGEPEISAERLAELQPRLQLSDRTLDLMMILYAHQLDAPISEHLKYCNQVSFWIWESRNLVNLERNFDRFEQFVPDHQRFLGCYLWDFGTGGSEIADLDLLRRQCQQGLEWLQEGRIEGMIFLPTTVCDLELESVEWVRRWIREVGDRLLVR